MVGPFVPEGGVSVGAVPEVGPVAGAFVVVIGAKGAFMGAIVATDIKEGTSTRGLCVGAAIGAVVTIVGCSVFGVDAGAFDGPNGTLMGMAVTAVGVLLVIGAKAGAETNGALEAPTGVFAGAATGGNET
jgi:hypothetical protein